jgi:hypothetical protein
MWQELKDHLTYYLYAVGTEVADQQYWKTPPPGANPAGLPAGGEISFLKLSGTDKAQM